MQRWLSILLLLSFVRLQLVCCCGSIGHCAEKMEMETVAQHSCGERHGAHSHELETACDSAEVGTADASCPYGDCLHCEHSPHHHVFLISHAVVGLAQASGTPKTIVMQQFIAAVVPLVDGSIATLSLSSLPRSPLGLGSRALLMLAQLRI